MSQIVITGSSSGLGLALAQKALTQNQTVIGLDKNLPPQDLQQNPNFQFFQLDLADFIKLEEIATKIQNPNILINNAGIFLEKGLEQISPSKIQQIINVNLTLHILLTSFLLPKIKKAQSSKVICNVSSIRGIWFEKNKAVYSATKSGLRGFGLSLSEELKSDKISVLNFYPAGIKTNLFGDQRSNQEEYQNFIDPINLAEYIWCCIKNSTNFRVVENIIERI